LFTIPALLFVSTLAAVCATGGVEHDAAPAKVEEVYPGIWRLRFGTPETKTPLSYRSARPAEKEIAGLPAASQLPIDPGGVLFRASARGLTIDLPMRQDEKIYGLGLNTAIFELSGRKAWVTPSDNPEAPTNESHAPEPFYVSSRGYGVYVDTARYAAFSIGDVDRKSAVAGVTGSEGVATSTAELYRHRDVGEKSIVVDVPAARGADVYLFAGPTPREAVQRYNLFAGGGCMPPLWGLGIAYRGKGNFSSNDIIRLAQSFRDADLPCDIFGIEPGWQTQTYSSSFVWNRDRFPDPDAFISRMHAMNYRLSFWEHPFTHPSSPIYKALEPYSGSYRVWGGLVPDFATAEGRRIYLRQQDEVLFSKGVDSVKIDEVDNQPFRSDPWSFPEFSAFPSGLDGEQMHSLFGVLAQQALLEPFEKTGRRTWGLVRNSHALSAPLPYVIYSDSYDHRDYVRGLAKSGFGGHLWTPEVRDAKSVEDLIRRIQTVIFSPYAMINCWYMKLPPWLQIDSDRANAGETMPEAPEATRLVRDLFRLRMSLAPYLYAAFNEYHRHGIPPVRALLLDYPADHETLGIDNQFMFGPSLMVAPLIAGEHARSVYFPAGDWYDYFTGEKIQGGKRMEVSKPLDQLPLYVKGNTLLPVAEPVQHIARDTEFRISVRIYGDRPESAVLYEDDGETLEYAKGAQNVVTLSWSNGKGSVTRSGPVKRLRYEVTGWAQAGR
jgi:alpha-D-xyloside xylohydrolase